MLIRERRERNVWILALRGPLERTFAEEHNGIKAKLHIIFLKWLKTIVTITVVVLVMSKLGKKFSEGRLNFCKKLN